MEFSYKAQGTISFIKVIAKIALGFEFVNSGAIKVSGIAKKMLVKIIKKILVLLKKIKHIYINKYKFIASGTSTAGGLSRKLLNKFNLKTSSSYTTRSFFY